MPNKATIKNLINRISTHVKYIDENLDTLSDDELNNLFCFLDKADDRVLESYDWTEACVEREEED